MTPAEPTSEQCSANAVLARADDGTWIEFACWYPQMGGYVGKCVVRAAPDDCFDAWVWHDGEFPFEGGSPVELHHCDPDQFVRFGETVKRMVERPAAAPLAGQVFARPDTPGALWRVVETWTSGSALVTVNLQRRGDAQIERVPAAEFAERFVAVDGNRWEPGR